MNPYALPRLSLSFFFLDIAEHCETIARAVLKEAQLGMTEDEKLVCRSFLSLIITNLRALIR